ncbi:MAG: chemotaxis protein CheW [Pseudomonadota bacterium]
MNTKERTGSIDWQTVRAHVKRAEIALKEALNPSPERAKAIMDARARALSQVPAPARPPGVGVDVVLFGLGKECYAIEARFVREVVRFSDYAPVPGTPEFIVGVTNLRGVSLAVVDLRRFFNVPQKGVTDLSRIIVLGTTQVEFGILADEAHGQIELTVNDILPVPDEVSGIGRAYLRGVTGEALIILDGAALLGDQRLIIGNEKESGI